MKKLSSLIIVTGVLLSSTLPALAIGNANAATESTIKTTTTITANGLAIKASEKNAVEAGIVEMQRDLLVPAIENTFHAYSQSDIKETGEAHFSWEQPIGASGSIKGAIDVEKYTGILSIIGLSQEVDFLIKGNLETHIPGMGTFDEKSGEYISGAMEDATYNFSLDTKVTLIDQKLYILVRDAQINASNAEKNGIPLDTIKKTIDTIKGKTLVVDIPTGMEDEANGGKFLAKIKKAVEILSEEPLLTPIKKSQNSYKLAVKLSTMNRISKLFNGNVSRGEIMKDIQDMNLWYAEINGKKLLVNKVRESDAVGQIGLIKENGEYTLTGKIEGKGSSKWNILSVYVTKNTANFYLNSKEANASLVWKDNYLSFESKGTNAPTISITGPLSYTNAQLVLSINGTAAGKFNASFIGKDRYVYDVSFTAPESITGSSGKFSFSVKENVEYGKYPITIPQNATPIEELQEVLNEIE